MTAQNEVEERRKLMDEINAIFEVEGHGPTPEIRSLQDQFVLGKISFGEFKTRMSASHG
jgi:hypothetical protein